MEKCSEKYRYRLFVKEQLYYIISGRGKMKLDGKIYEVRPGDSVHIPPKVKHQLINAGDDWVEHILVSAPVT